VKTNHWSCRASCPNLLVNGSGGIAVGMATNIPPHNLNEVVDACLHLLRNPEASIDELMEIMPGARLSRRPASSTASTA
jgi:DNA gyrase/topoisomerase IV subunit A